MQFKSKTPFGRRVYESGESAIAVQGEVPLKGSFSTSIPYRDLRSEFDRLYLRSNYFQSGMMIAAASLLAHIVEIQGLKWSAWDTVPMLTVVFVGIGAFLMVLGYRRYEIFRFRNRAGMAVLDVFPDGPMRREFPSFVDELVKRVNLASNDERA